MVKKTLNFKRIAILTIALLAFSFGVKAQSWYIMGEYVWSPPHPQGTYMELHEQGESVVINGLEYNTIYVHGEGLLLGAYRNEDNQVYYCKWNGSAYDEEVMLYDYDLEEGDFFNDTDTHPMMVNSVSTITDCNGVERKRIDFVFIGLEGEREYWIEGVGSSRGFVHSGDYETTSDGAIFHLLCYHVGNDVIYVDPVYDACDIDEIAENSTNNSLSIYPNPANDFIKISNIYQMEITKVEVIDMLGRTLISTKNTEEIDVSSLSEGQYLVKIYGESDIVKKLTISK